MESENVKRSSLVKTPKPSTTPVTTVEGTSVTPRQRPKGQAVSAGPISLSGQIVSQISGQGSQCLQSQSSAGNSTIPFVQMGQQVGSLNVPSQSYIVGQSMQQNVQPAVGTNIQATQSSLVQVTSQICTNSQTVSFVQAQTQQAQYSPAQQSQSSVIGGNQQSPVTVQDKKNSYYFESKSGNKKVDEENLEALFPPSGKEILNRGIIKYYS